MSKNILIVASTASMISHFNMDNITLLQKHNVKVHVATNFKHPASITTSNSERLIKHLKEMGVSCYQVNFSRGIGTHQSNKKALAELLTIIKDNNIDGIHTHAPLASIIARRAARRTNTKIIYTAHGFQFFKGGPLRDWFIFFPVEWFYGRWTDALITINSQDFRASRFLPVKRRYYIPGVGTSINKVIENQGKVAASERMKFRKIHGIDDDDFLIISVGELNRNKNHSTVIKAIHQLNNPKLKYFIAGIGSELTNLQSMVKEYQLEEQVKFLGYINDLDGLYYAADLNVFVSRREGLGLGGLDGVAHGLYIIGSRRTGMKDYITSEHVGLLVNDPMDVGELSNAINKVIDGKYRVDDVGLKSIEKFDSENVNKLMEDIYSKEFKI